MIARIHRASVVVAVVLLMADARGQLRVQPVDLENGVAGLGLVLRQLATTAVFMQATAHPDDETNALHVFLSRGMGVRTILATATRGDGGQNEIGHELYDPLAVLRTAELETMHRFDGTEQYFTRAVDFGYSFSVEETFEKWGRDEIVGDYVRLIRTTRPDVVLGMTPVGTGGGLHHQASAVLSREAFRAAGDPTRFPEQLKEGLTPWQPRKFYYPAGNQGGVQASGAPLPLGAIGMASFDISAFDPLLGRTYPEIGAEERGMHKSQAMGQLLALPAPRTQARYLLMESHVSKGGAERSLFEGIDVTWRGLAVDAGEASPTLGPALAAIEEHVSAAQRQFESNGPFAAAPALLAGLTRVKALRTQLASMTLESQVRTRLDDRLKTKEAQFTDAVLLAHGTRIEVLADDGVVVPGQSTRVAITIGSRGRPVVVAAVALHGFAKSVPCAPGRIDVETVYRCESPSEIPLTARITRQYWKRMPDVARYEFEPDAPFGLPFRPTPFRAEFVLESEGTTITVERPIQFRYEGGQLEGEKRMELTVVPVLALRTTPAFAIVPVSAQASSHDREIFVTVTNHGRSATTGTVRLERPAGWTVTPETQPVTLTREDESQTVRFSVRPAAAVKTGDYPIRAVASVDGQSYTTGYQVVEYPHIRRQQIEVPALVTAKVMDVRLPPNLRVGYVMGTGDDVPAALAGLGASVRLLGAADLSWGNLAEFDAIVIGVRAYDQRDDLRANHQRLLAYAESGGTLVVQYNRNNSWTTYAPFPVRFSNTRVTDEHGEVQVLAPADPAFSFPNTIGPAAWRGWVQERGTYFIVPDDPRYTDLIQINEPFPNNAGWKKGALVTAPLGRGSWTFVGLGLWRQVAAGTDGAFQLLANLVSRGRASRN